MFCRSQWMLLLLAFPAAWADSRPDLNGVWRLDPALSEIHSHLPAQLTWQIEQGDNSIHLIQRAQEKKNADDIRCATDGHDCKVKEEGHSASVSFYYNGSVLVELETEGQSRDTVTKKRLHVSGDGATLTVEVIHISPPGKPAEKLILTRQPGPGDH